MAEDLSVSHDKVTEQVIDLEQARHDASSAKQSLAFWLR
jgi:hypothetical protein